MAFVARTRAHVDAVARAHTGTYGIVGDVLRKEDIHPIALAARSSLGAEDVLTFSAVVFGAGDSRTRTEDRASPPALSVGDRLAFGSLAGTIDAMLGHPRLVTLRFEAEPPQVWAGLARHGRPIQYAYVPAPLALWDVWTPIAGVPAAFEAPSASFVLDWDTLRDMRARRIDFATLTHAAGLSSTGDAALDRRLPFDEPYVVPAQTAAAIRPGRAEGGRIIAIGTTVVRALEHAAARTGIVAAGPGVARQRIGPWSRIRIVDAMLSGTHEPGSSHHHVLRALADDETLERVHVALEAFAYRTHEFGDSVFVEKMERLHRRVLPGQRPAGAARGEQTAGR